MFMQRLICAYLLYDCEDHKILKDILRKVSIVLHFVFEKG